MVDAAPDVLLPAALAPGQGPDTINGIASFETHVLGVVVHGLELDPLLLLTNTPPAWETQMAAALQQQEEVRAVPIVILTAKDLTVAERQRLRGPIEKILRKGSLSPDQLLAEVGAVMASHPRRR